MKAVFIAATGQDVGKTTTCLGLVAGLLKRHKSIGYMKPVGQEHVATESGSRVDKDVLLFRTYFQLDDTYSSMSPVLFPRGFTRDYLDGKVSRDALVEKITLAKNEITERHPITIVEGTGHTGVGSIVNLNNAQVAAHLNLPVLLIASGGLGSSFDELDLNKTQCEKYGAKVAGIILNRVLPDKREMVTEYMGKALKRWDIPLVGCIPFDPFLTTPTMGDFEQLFQTSLITGEESRYRHFENIRLVASSVEVYRSLIGFNQVIITPAGREDIILATLSRYWDVKIAHPDEDLTAGMILTGKHPPKQSIIDQIRKTGIPMLYIPLSSFAAMKMIHSTTTKIRSEDTVKIQEAINVVQSHIDFDLLEHLLSRP